MPASSLLRASLPRRSFAKPETPRNQLFVTTVLRTKVGKLFPSYFQLRLVRACFGGVWGGAKICCESATKRGNVVSSDHIDLLIDQLRVGNLLDQHVLRTASVVSRAEKLEEKDWIRSDADVWILLAMSGLLEKRPVQRNMARSTASIASQLGYTRERVGMRTRSLCEKQLVSQVSSMDSQDGRRKEYQISAKGRRVAGLLLSELRQLERDVRFEAGLNRRARTVDAQKVACALWALGDMETNLLMWLDRV